MIPLPSDCLVFEFTGQGEIPCCATAVRLELAGDGASLIDPHLLQNAAAAVLHYFRNDLNRSSISVQEFSAALEKVLHGFGLTHVKAAASSSPNQVIVAETDLRTLTGDGMELIFFQRLREELRRQLHPAPQVLHFHGLRDCIKQLVGARRWTQRCQFLNDQVVDYLRTSLCAEGVSKPCSLLVV